MFVKPYYEKIPLNNSTTFIAREFIVDELSYPLHHHPYFEINFILKGSGKRIVGNQISDFNSQDLTLIGPNLPHQFKKNEFQNKWEGKYHSIIVQFHTDIFGENFITKTEIATINTLLGKAQRGIVFYPSVVKTTSPLVKKLVSEKGFTGVLLFLEILGVLAETKEFQFLSEINWENRVTGKDQQETDKIFRYIFEHFTEEITLNQVSEVAGVSKSAFSHYLKKRTGKTYSVFMNELRISHSLKLLTETNKTVLEICYQSGFNNLSYFNRVFKNINSLTPLEYRRKHSMHSSTN